MKEKTKIDAYIDALEKQGIDRRDAVPPLYRWFWSLGLHVRPPLNQSMFSMILHHLIFFVIVFPIVMYILGWIGLSTLDGGLLIFVALFSGTISGYMTARRFKKLGTGIDIPEL